MKKNCLHDQNCPVCGSAEIFLWGSAVDIGNKKTKHKIVKCKFCTHIFIDNIPPTEFLNEAYKTNNPSVTTGGNEFFETRSSGPLSEVDNWVLSYVSEMKINGSLLDVGSANVKLLQKIKALGWKVTVVEPGAHAGKLRELLQCRIYDCVFEKCDFDDKYEVVSAIDVLEHVSSPIDFLRRLKNILSANGVALFRFPNSNSLQCRLNKERWEMIRPLGHLHFFSPRSFRTACDICELKTMHISSHDLRNYSPIMIRGRRFPLTKILTPVRKILNDGLFGDQLLVKVRHA